jgi:hypothetical protein
LQSYQQTKPYCKNFSIQHINFNLYIFNLPEEDCESGENRFVVRLPIWPQTLEDLRLILFWLRPISTTCFHRVTFYELFNPELLELLFHPTPASSPVQFRAAEMLTFYYLPPLAYGSLVRARAVKFLDEYAGFPFLDLLQLLCAFAVSPRQVVASIPDDDREHLFEVGRPFPSLVSY